MINKFIVLILTFFTSVSSFAAYESTPGIIILATPSISLPLIELASTYTRLNNIKITTSFNSGSQQIKQINDGTTANIFISANPIWMDKLKKKGLIDPYNIVNLAKNKLILATTSRNYYKINNQLNNLSLKDKLFYLSKVNSIAISNPQSTALGFFSNESLNNLSYSIYDEKWESLKDNLITLSNADETLNFILKNDQVGIVYYNSLNQYNSLKLIDEINGNLHSPIIYQVAVAVGENTSYAKEFVRFLQTNEAKSIFTKYGFLVDVEEQ